MAKETITTHTETADQQHRNCPYCGEQILSIAKKCKHCGEFLKPSSGALHFRQPCSADKEKTIWEGNPSHLYYVGHYILGTLLVPFYLIGLLIILYAIFDQRSQKFTVTNRKLISQTGIISRNVHEVAIQDIRNINFKQGIVERIFGLGTVEVGSAGTGGIEVTFKGIRRPQKVKEMISELKHDVQLV